MTALVPLAEASASRADAVCNHRLSRHVYPTTAVRTKRKVLNTHQNVEFAADVSYLLNRVNASEANLSASYLTIAHVRDDTFSTYC